MAKSIKRKTIYSAAYVRAQMRRDLDTSGLTQRAYAKRLRESEEQVSLALTGRRNPSQRALRHLGFKRVIAYCRSGQS
jgi:hypothetical protein